MGAHDTVFENPHDNTSPVRPRSEQEDYIEAVKSVELVQDILMAGF
jgi:hypothetical protein